MIDRDARRGRLEFLKVRPIQVRKPCPQWNQTVLARTYCFVMILQSGMLVRKKTSLAITKRRGRETCGLRERAIPFGLHATPQAVWGHTFRDTPVDTVRANQDGKPAEQVVKRVIEQAVDRDARRGTLLQTWDFEQASKPVQEPKHEYPQMPSISPEWIQIHRVTNHSFEDVGAPGDDAEVAEHPYALPSRPALHHHATAPVEPPMLRSSIDTAPHLNPARRGLMRVS